MDVRSFIVDVGGVVKCCRVADVDDDDRCNKIPVDLKAFRVALPSSSCGVTLANNRKEDKMALKEIK